MRRSRIFTCAMSVPMVGCTSDRGPLPVAPSDVAIALRPVESIDMVAGTSGRGSVEIVRTGDTRGARTLEFEGVPIGVRVTFDEDIAPTLRSGRAYFSIAIDGNAGDHALGVLAIPRDRRRKSGVAADAG
jgi:hypothetical protein